MTRLNAGPERPGFVRPDVGSWDHSSQSALASQVVHRSVVEG
jgi:hypothetical protein